MAISLDDGQTYFNNPENVDLKNFYNDPNNEEVLKNPDGTRMTEAEFGKSHYENFVDPAMSTNVMNFTLSTRYGNSLKTNLNLTTNTSELSTGPGVRGTQDFLTTNFDAEYPFLENRILAKGGLNFAKGSGLVDMSWVGFKAGLRWKIMDGFSLNTHGEFRSKETGGVQKNTVIARANLEYAF